MARGEKPIGRKIGFTNRNIWAEYGASSRSGATSTTPRCATWRRATASRSRICRSRASSPRSCSASSAISPDMSLRRLRRRSAGWRMASRSCSRFFPAGVSRWRTASPMAACTADCSSDRGVNCRTADAASCSRPFRLTITLSRDGEARRHRLGRQRARRAGPGAGASGRGARKDRLNPPLRAGEIVTTGTLTRAFPVLPGEPGRRRSKGSTCPAYPSRSPEAGYLDRSCAMASLQHSASSRAARFSASAGREGGEFLARHVVGGLIWRWPLATTCAACRRAGQRRSGPSGSPFRRLARSRRRPAPPRPILQRGDDERQRIARRGRLAAAAVEQEDQMVADLLRITRARPA